MGLSDPHDPRTFTHFVKLNPDGSVAAVVEVADDSLAHHDPAEDGFCYIDITEYRRTRTVVDLFALKLDAATVQRAMAKPLKERPTLNTELRTAFARALPAALVDVVFGASDGGQ